MSEYKLNPPTVSSYAENMMLRILFEHKGFSEVFRENGWRSDDIANAFGLPDELESHQNLRAIARQVLKERYKTLEKSTALPSDLWKQAYENLEKLSLFLELSQVEQDIFRFVIHLRSEEPMRDLLSYLPKSDLQRTVALLADLLKHPKNHITPALKKGSKLEVYGLIGRNYNPDRIYEYLEWGKTLDFDEFITQPLNEFALLKSCTNMPNEPRLQLDHFEHIAEMRKMILAYLRQALQNHQKGVNILIYGLPGTGKTEFAGLVAQALNIQAYNITYMDSDGDIVKAEQRLNYIRLAQTLLNGKRAVLIFDEIEDVFRCSLFEDSVAQKSKAWTNQLLENNHVPIIWLSNSVQDVDPAFLRRFDFVFEMPDLPLKNKSALITQLADGKLTEEYIWHLAKVRSLSPAILTRVFNVANAIDEGKIPFIELLLRLFNEILSAQGKKKIEPLPKNKFHYNLNWVSCKEDIHKLSEGLKRVKKGRICCYGPPGTGKTAWAGWLADQLDMPLLFYKGSDLLDPYVGGTEQKIAEAFERAKRDNCLLVLDEVDTFLFSRDGAERSWERSQVNEMLVQIEHFEGLIVVSTNLMNVLDPAALRRFDLKLKFDYLTSQQRLDFAKQQADKLTLGEWDEAHSKVIETLNLLTPGDFATVARRHHFSPFENVEYWLEALLDECRMKPEFSSKRVGF